MNNYVITIARGFGSGGRQTGVQLAKALNIPLYDREILQEASHSSGLSEALFQKSDEKVRRSFLVKQMQQFIPSRIAPKPEQREFISDDNLFRLQSQIIRELGASESFVIIGRCADYILRGNPNVISVYIEASREDCSRSVMEMYGVSKEEADGLIASTDKARAKYYTYHTNGGNWMDPINYDLTLNSTRVGRENCAEVIVEYLRIRGFL